MLEDQQPLETSESEAREIDPAAWMKMEVKPRTPRECRIVPTAQVLQDGYDSYGAQARIMWLNDRVPPGTILYQALKSET